MFYKGLVFATAAVLATLSALTAASAAPAFNGIVLERDGASITKVDYYYPGGYDGEAPYYGNREAPYYGNTEAPYRGGGLADGDVIGGALGAVTGAIGGALHGSGAYGRPYYGPSYYDGPNYGNYSGAYEESPVSACERSFPSFDPQTGTYITDSGDEFLCPYLDR